MDTTLLQGLALLETRDGQKTIKGPNGEDSFNLFNVKDFSGKGFRAFDKAEGSRDAYRIYGSREESIQDLLSLLDRRYPEARRALDAGDASGFAKALKAGGYATDPAYEQKLTNTIASVRKKRELDPQTAQAVTRSAAAGEGAASQLAPLRAEYGDLIDDALAKGYQPGEIVAYIAGAAQKQGADARAASDAKGAVGRFVDQAGVGLGNVGRSLSRVGSMVTGDQEGLQRKLAEQQAIDNDLSNVADRASTAGGIGGFVGDNAAALVPVPGLQGAGLVTRLALQGAGSGALQGITTSRGKDLGEVAGDTATNALIGTVGGAGLGAGVRGLSRAKQFAQGAARQGQRLEAVEADELGRVTQEAGKRMGVQAKALDTDFVAETQPILGKRIEDSYGGLTGTVDEQTLKHINRLRAEAGLDALDGGPLPLKVIDQTRAAVRKELSSPNNSAFKREALSTLEGKLTRSVDEAFQAAPEQGAQYRLAKKQYDNFRVVRDLVASTNGDVRQLLDANKWAAAQKRGTNRSRFVKGDAPMQDITAMLQDAKSQSRIQHGPLGRAAETVLGAADVLPVTGPLARVLGFRDLLQRLGDPKVRAAFEQLNPVEQAAVMAAAH